MSTVLIGKSGKGINAITATTTLSDLESKGTFVIEKEIKDEPVEPLCEAVEEKRFWFQRKKGFNPDTVATMRSVFDNPDTAGQYKPRPDWENIHRFDPTARWTWGEEYRVVRKIDMRIMFGIFIVWMVQELDRANLTQALSDNLLDDLHLNTNDYNLATTIGRAMFFLAELPAQLLSKRFGPDRWLPTQMILWSVTAASQFWISGRASFLVCRTLIGVFTAGFIPEVILYLSQWYKHHELAIRLGFLFTAMSFADMFASIIAYGILHMRGIEGLAGWRWLFLIEGVISLMITFVLFFTMPPGPCETKSFFRGQKGWFTPREEEIIVNRIIREDPTKSYMHNRQGISPKLLWSAVKDYDLWPLYIIGLSFTIPAMPPALYLTLSLRKLGFDTFQTNLLAIPHSAFHIITMLAVTYAGEVFTQLAIVSMLCQVWTLPFLIYLNSVDITKVNRWSVYIAITLLISKPSSHAIQAAWTSRNSNSIHSRAVSAVFYNMVVQGGFMIAANIYRQDDAPRYKRGNKILLCILIFNICLFIFAKLYYTRKNKRREQKWNAMTEEQQLDYLQTTTDVGNKRLDFRFAS